MTIKIVFLRFALSLAGLLLLALPAVTIAAPTLGPVIRVNDQTLGDQRIPAVARTADGGFIAVWEAEVSDGGAVDIFARHFDASGTALGPSVRVNSYTPNRQAFPAVAVNSSGQFVVAWDSNGQDGPGINVYARSFNADGTPLSSDVRVNDGKRDAQLRVAVAMDEAGNYIVAWPEREAVSSLAAGLKVGALNGRRFQANGVPYGVQFEIEKSYSKSLRVPGIAMSSSGEFVVVWNSSTPADSSGLAQGPVGIFARRYDAKAAPLAASFQIDQTANPKSEIPDRPGVAMTADGRFAVAWERLTPEYAALGLFARSYDSAGNAVTAEFRVGTQQAGLHYPSITIDDQARITIAAHGGGIFVQRYSATGSPLEPAIRADVSDPGYALSPALAQGPAGQIILVWQDFGTNGDGAGRGLSARLLDYP